MARPTILPVVTHVTDRGYLAGWSKDLPLRGGVFLRDTGNAARVRAAGLRKPTGEV